MPKLPRVLSTALVLQVQAQPKAEPMSVDSPLKHIEGVGTKSSYSIPLLVNAGGAPPENMKIRASQLISYAWPTLHTA